MMSYLKFVLVFLIEILRKNIIKLLMLIGAILCFTFAGTFADSVDVYDVVDTTKVDNNYIYICRTISDNKIKYENIWGPKELHMVNNTISISSYHVANIVLWVVFSILALILLIISIIGQSDDDIGWELEDCWKEAFSTLIYCEEENGYFYYFALGRLISKMDRQVVRNYRITNELSIDGFRDLYRCPKYQTKTQKRETFLTKIGIK